MGAHSERVNEGELSVVLYMSYDPTDNCLAEK